MPMLLHLNAKRKGFVNRIHKKLQQSIDIGYFSSPVGPVKVIPGVTNSLVFYILSAENK